MGRLNLSNRGWTADSIKSGERVTVTGTYGVPGHVGPFDAALLSHFDNDLTVQMKYEVRGNRGREWRPLGRQLFAKTGRRQPPLRRPTHLRRPA